MPDCPVSFNSARTMFKFYSPVWQVFIKSIENMEMTLGNTRSDYTSCWYCFLCLIWNCSRKFNWWYMLVCWTETVKFTSMLSFYNWWYLLWNTSTDWCLNRDVLKWTCFMPGNLSYLICHVHFPMLLIANFIIRHPHMSPSQSYLMWSLVCGAKATRRQMALLGYIRRRGRHPWVEHAARLWSAGKLWVSDPLGDQYKSL